MCMTFFSTDPAPCPGKRQVSPDAMGFEARFYKSNGGANTMLQIIGIDIMTVRKPNPRP